MSAKLQNQTKAIIAHLKNGENNLWEAAEALALLVGNRDDRKGGEVVDEILREMPYYSRDKIYRLARAGRAYRFTLSADEELSEQCRKLLTVSHMEAVASCVERGDCKGAGAVEWLRLAINGKWGVERLRAELPKNGRFSYGGWNWKAKRTAEMLRALATDETLGAKDTKVMTALRLMKLTADWLERMTQ
jgi:hypothetical protein